jgi:hypothetical protein
VRSLVGVTVTNAVTEVRSVKNSEDYKAGEYSAFCAGCDCELAVVPPKTLRSDDAVWDWLDTHYFYCPTCQKSEGRPAVEAGA